MTEAAADTSKEKAPAKGSACVADAKPQNGADKPADKAQHEQTSAAQKCSLEANAPSTAAKCDKTKAPTGDPSHLDMDKSCPLAKTPEQKSGDPKTADLKATDQPPAKDAKDAQTNKGWAAWEPDWLKSYLGQTPAPAVDQTAAAAGQKDLKDPKESKDPTDPIVANKDPRETPAPAAAAAAGLGNSWSDWLKGAYNQAIDYASIVTKATESASANWDKAESLSNKLAESCKTGDACSVPKAFDVAKDNNTRKLTETEHRYIDKAGNTVVYDKANHTVTSQDKDGDSIYSRSKDGHEVYTDVKKGMQYEKRDGQYLVRDAQGHETKVSDQGTITQINDLFSVAQTATRSDAIGRKAAVAGRMTSYSDAQEYKLLHTDTTVLAHTDSQMRDFATSQGKFRFNPQDHSLSQLQPDGTYRALSEDERSRFGFRRCEDGRFQGHGVKFGGQDNKVDTDDGTTLGQKTEIGVKATIPDGKNPPVELTNIPHPADPAKPGEPPKDSSDLKIGNHEYVVDPNDSKHFVQGFNLNDDGSRVDATPNFNYDCQDHVFDAGQVQFTDDGTKLDWNNTFIDPDGGMVLGPGTYSYDQGAGANDYTSDTSAQASDTQVLVDSSGDISNVEGKIGSGIVTGGDVADLIDALNDVNSVLGRCLANNDSMGAARAGSIKMKVDAALGKAQEAKNITEKALADGVPAWRVAGHTGEIARDGGVDGFLRKEEEHEGGFKTRKDDGIASLASRGFFPMDELQRTG